LAKVVSGQLPSCINDGRLFGAFREFTVTWKIFDWTKCFEAIRRIKTVQCTKNVRFPIFVSSKQRVIREASISPLSLIDRKSLT
jgi:hypothetical protein